MNTKDIALISVFSAVWVAAQVYLGPAFGQITIIHGVVQRLVGWLLMLIMAELIGKFGRVSIMSTVAALATRIIRRSASLYVWAVGAGYALGGLTFDLLFFIPGVRNFSGRTRKVYVLTVSLISGVLALVPYILYKLFTLSSGFPEFIVWILGPAYAPGAVLDVVLNVLGTFIGLSILPLIKPWSPNMKQQESKLSSSFKYQLIGSRFLRHQKQKDSI